MNQFCKTCNNLLQAYTDSDELVFKCMSCYNIYKSDPDDSLRYEETKCGNLVIFQTILNKAVKDNVNLRAYIPCPKCKYNKAKQVRLGNELRLINICEKCKFQWIAMD
jgi:DNA-directed RNA polymerase subunit M/transcription elongation factor TFIIS